MSIEIIRDQQYIVHQAIVLTNRKNLKDFSLEKVAIAYQIRSGCIGDNSAIWELEFHPTNICNLRCAGCSYASRHDNMSLNVEQIAYILEQYLPYDLRSVFFSGGGDPLLWNGWDDFFTSIEKKCSYGIATNMFNFKKIIGFWDLVDFYQIHLTGYNADSCKLATGVDAFKPIDENIVFLLSNQKPSQDVALKILISEENYMDLNQFLDYVCGKRVNSIVLKFKQDFLNNRDYANPNVLNTIREIIYSHQITKEYDYLLDNLDDIVFSTYPKPKKCLFANSGLYRLITAEGEVFPCIAANANRKNKISNETGFIDIYSKEMRDEKCPLKACRHYRFSQYLSHQMNLVDFSETLNYEPLLL